MPFLIPVCEVERQIACVRCYQRLLPSFPSARAVYVELDAVCETLGAYQALVAPGPHEELPAPLPIERRPPG